MESDYQQVLNKTRRPVMSESTVTIRESNKKFAQNNPQFKVACRLAGTEPTRRQASKFRGGSINEGNAKKAMRSFLNSGYATERRALETDTAQAESKLYQLNNRLGKLETEIAAFGLEDPKLNELKKELEALEEGDSAREYLEALLSSLEEQERVTQEIASVERHIKGNKSKIASLDSDYRTLGGK